MKARFTGTQLVSSILLAIGLTFMSTANAKAQCPLDPQFTYQKSCDSANHITFINQTDTLSGGMVDFYEWDFGDGNTSNEVNPEHTYASTGFYIVTLNVYDTSGCYEDYTWPVNVSPLPVASFTFSPDSSCSTSPIVFNSSGSIGSGLSFSWNFGDGATYTTTSTTVSHQYNAINNAACDPYQSYTVTLTVTDFHGCTSTVSHVIHPKRRPDPQLADVSGYNFSNCHNDPDPSNPNDTLTVLNLTPNMACVDSMRIQWGDGSVSHGLQSGDFPLTHIYTQLGIFNLVFTVYGSNGCSAQSTYTVANQANPNVGLSAIGQNTGCAPFYMKFKLEGYENNSTGTYYVWDFGDGTTVTWGYNQPFINDTIEHFYTQSHCEFGLSSFTVSVTAYNECNSATMQYPSLTVYYPPEAAFYNDPMGCVGTPVQFINNSMNGYGGNCDSTTNYIWYFGDGGVSGDVEPMHTYTEPGTYTIQLVASNSKCGSTDSIRTITITGVHPDFSFDPVCVGDSMHFTDLSYGYDTDWGTPSPSVPIVQWHWDFGDGDTSDLQHPSHLYAAAGVYTVSLTATSSVGCDSTIQYDVTVDEIIIDSVDYGNISCYGYDNGWITVHATSQITPIQYTLLPLNLTNTTGQFTNLPPGTYIITLEDTICTAVTDSITLTEPDDVTIDSLNVIQPLCYGEFGAAQVFASGGYSLVYTLYPDSIVNTSGYFANLGHGTYFVVVEDTAGCPPDTTDPFDIIVPPELVIDSVIVDHISCYGANDGIITIYASGGISSQPYIFTISSGGSGNSNSTGIFSGLTAGWYLPSVEDVNGCITTADSVEIIDPPEIILDSLYLQHISCYNANDGYIYVQASGGTGNLIYTLFPDSIVNTTGEFVNLATNTYNVVIEDENGCALNVPNLYIDNPAPIVIDSIGFTHITCNNYDDGTITVHASGGSGLIYTLLPDNIVNTTGIFTGLDEGAYNISVTDTNSCPAVTGGPVNIINPPVMQVDSITAQDLTCPGADDGIVQAWASGGIDTLDYAYVLNPGTDSLFNNTGLFTGLAPGGYIVAVTDANGCTVFSDSVDVNSPYQLELDTLIVQDITCHDYDDGIIEVYMIGGTGTLTYTLFPDSIVNLTGAYSNLDEGTYYVEVLDVNGCIFTIPNLVINNPDPIYIDSLAYGHISCHNFNDGWFQVYGSGGTNLNYTLFPDNISNTTGLFTGLDAGQYYVTVNDTNICPPVISDTIEILNPALLQIDSTLVENLSCPGADDGSITAYASGGIDTIPYAYILNPGTDSIVNQSGLFSGLQPGSYVVRVQDANGCTARTDSLEVLSPDPLVLDSFNFYDISCHNFDDGIIEVYVSGGTGALSYTLYPDSVVNSTGLFNNLAANVYYVVVQDENGCSITSPNMAINNPDAIVIDSLAYDHVTCHNDNNGWIQAYAHGGTTLNYTLYPDLLTNATGLFENLSGGGYWVGVSDANGCPEVISDTISINNPDLLVIDSVDVQQITCHDADDGQIQVYASGGIDTVAYMYILNPATDSIVNYTGFYNNLNEGIYVVRVVDANGCTTITGSLQITNPPALNLDFQTIDDVTCYGANDGLIVTQVSGGTGILTYTLYPDSLSNATGVFNNLDGGSYWVRAEDENGCYLDILNLNVFEPAQITVDSLEYQNITCHDDNDGWIQAYGSGGNTLSYTLYPDGITNPTGLFTGLDAGEYFVYISDNQNCPPAISDTISIINPDQMVVDSLLIQHLSCPGTNDGIIEVYASGGIDSIPYTYILNPGSVTNNTGIFTGLSPDTYVVEVADINGCSVSTGNIPVHSPYQLVVDSLVVEDITCHDFNDGIIEVYMLGGTGTLTYTLMPGNITDTVGIFHNLAANNYTVLVEDINGCTITVPNLIINNPDAIVLDSLNYQSITCHNDDDGWIQVYAHGGTNLNYTLYPSMLNNATGLFSNLSGGQYWIAVSDDNGCPGVISDTINIYNPDLLVVDSVVTQDISCPGNNDGTIEVFASGGIDSVPYTFTLNPGNQNIVNTSGLYTGLAPGGYIVQVVDLNGCIAFTDSLELLSPDPILLDSVIVTDITCHNFNDGSIEVLVTGGTGSLTYTLLPDNISNSIGVFLNLSGNTYSIVVEDINGCTLNIPNLTVYNPDAIVIDSTSYHDITCHNDDDGWIQVYAQGGNNLNYTLYPLMINNTSGLFENLSGGQYWVAVSDDNGCPDVVSDTINIINPDLLVVDSALVSHLSCPGYNDGTIEVFASGGINSLPYTFVLNPGNENIVNNTGLYTGLAPGGYIVQVSDANGCITYSDSLDILTPDPLIIDSIVVTDITCHNVDDGSIGIYINGGTGTLTYTLNPGSLINTTGQFANLAGNTYEVWVEDINGCILTIPNLVVNNPDPIVIDSVASQDITCNNDNDGWIQVYANGGTGLIYNLYQDTLDPANPYLTNSTGLFQNLDGRDYYILVTDSLNCTPDTYGPVPIQNPALLVVDSTQSENITCHGFNDGWITAYASGGIQPYTFILLPDSSINLSGSFTSLSSGIYRIRVIDSNGCEAESGIIQILEPNPVTFDTAHTDLTCYGADDGTITILNPAGGTGAYEYSIDNGLSWSSGNYFQGLMPGNYFVQVRDANLCTTPSIMISITEPALLQITSFNVTTPTCFGCNDGEVFANVTGGTPPYSHSWSNGMSGNPITGIPTGTYTDTVTDANGCVTWSSVYVGQPDSLVLSVTTQNISCYGDSTGWANVSVGGGTPPYSYSWIKEPDPTVIGTSATLNNITAGFYTVTVTDFFNVTAMETVEITQPGTGLYVSFNYTDTLCYGDSDGWAKANVSGGTAPYYYLWSGGTAVFTDSIYNLIPGTYSLTITDDNGCILTDSITIHENPLLLVAAVADPSTICGNGSSQLTATPTGGTPPFDYSWTPVDSLSNPFIYNPVANPLVTTNYTVTVTDQRGCTAMDMVTLNVLPTPIADFSYNNPCASNLVYFTNLSSGNGGTISSFYWDFGDGSYSSQTNPVHYYDNVDSTYTVMLIASNGNGCADTSIQNVYVNPFLGLTILADTSCFGNPTNFSYSLSNPAAVIDSCLWDFGDGNTSTSHNPSHTYSLPGLYNVYLTVYDHSGCVEMSNINVRVYPDPVAGFNDSTSCQDNLTYFEDISQGGGSAIVTWHWDFGDGSTSSLQDPVHGYAIAGTYDVTLTVTNTNGCMDSITNPVVVFNRPVAAFVADSGCVGSVIHFTDMSYSYNGTLNYWFWDFGDGQTSVAQNPVHVYDAAATYPVTLVVGTTLGCYDTVTQFVPVYELPQASFAVNTVCTSQPAQFIDQSVPNADSIVSWYWNFGDGYTSNVQNPVHIFSGQGTYNVLLRVTNSNGCVNDTTVSLQIDPLPIADFSFSTILCQNDTTYFTDLSVPNADSLVAWSWDFGDGNTSNMQNPSHVYGSSGIYNVMLAVTNSNGCIDSTTQALMIQQQPVADFAYDTACVGQTTHFYDQSYTQVGQIIDWYWEFDDPSSGPLNTSTLQNPDHSFVLPGIYDVMLVVTNSNYCRDTIIKQVSITEPPIADFTNGTSCKSDTTWFYDLSVATVSPIVAWIWDFGDGTVKTYYTDTDTVGHVYNQSGQYHVTLTVLDTNGCADSETKMITAYPLPTALFEVYENCVNNVTHFTDYSNGAGANITAWFWDFGDPASGASNYSTLQNPTHVYTQPGIYDVYLHVTNANGCSNYMIQTIEVFPGPVADFSTDTVCLNTPTYFDNLSYAIGENIISWNWDFGDGTQSQLQYPIHTYTAPGTYYVALSVTTENGCTDDTTKIVKVNRLPVADFEYAEPSCFGDSTYFTDLSYSIGSNIINNWYWDFGDGTTSTVQHPVHLYGAYGTYMVTLTVSDTNGCSATTQEQVIINQGPVAEFSYMTNSCDTVQFTDQSSGMGTPIYSWYWDFGDPASGWNNYSTQQHPTHVYIGSGIYTVMLIVTDEGGCIDTAYHTLDLQKPEADFTWDDACAGSPTQFYNLSTSPASPIVDYHWDFGDGSTSTLQNPVHTYVAAGIYYTTLTVTTENGCSDIITRPVTIFNNPVADFATNTPVCFGDTTEFTDLSYSIGSNIITGWLWEFGDGTTSTLQNPRHLYATAGYFTVNLTVSDTNGCSDTETRTILINALPVASFSYDTESCDTVYFTDHSTGVNDSIISWFWDFGDPASGMNNYSTQEDPVHHYVNGGTYTVTLTVTDEGGCISTVSQTLDLERPVADFTFTNVCEGSPTQFTDQSYSNGSPIITWLWDFGDGYTSVQQNPQHTYLMSGTYVVTLRVSSVNGCDDMISKVVEVYESPLADFEYTEPNCEGDSTYFYDLSMPGSAAINSWLWDFGDGTGSIEENPVHLYSAGGTYNVTLTIEDENGCGSTMMQEVFVNPRPVADFIYSTISCDTVSFTDQSVGSGDAIVAWFWDFGDPASGWDNYSTVQNPDHVYASSGTYNVQLIVTDAHGCKDTVLHSIDLYQPVADFSADTACYGTATAFTDLSYCTGGNINSWLWSFGDGTNSTVQNPMHTYAAPGYYYVTLTVGSTNGCQAQVMKQVYVQYNPSADFSWNGVCQGAPTYFTDESTVPNNGIVNNWLWDFGDGNTSTDQNPVHTYASAGVYQVTLTAWATYGCSHSMSKTVIISDSPIADFFADAACQGDATQFTDLSYAPGSTITYWWWDFGDGQYATNVQHPQHVYPYAGTYTVTLIVGNLDGCQDTTQQDVTVRPLPVADFAADTACVSFPTQFTDLSLPSGEIINWSWNFGDPASGAANHSGLQNPQHYYNTPGSYNVTLTVTDLYGCDHTVIKPIMVTEGPYANFSFINNQCANAVVDFTDLSISTGGYITTWIWIYGDGTPADTIYHPDNPDAQHAYSQPGAYTVSLKVFTSGGCFDVINKILMIIPSPQADFSYVSNCEGEEVVFTDQSIPNGGNPVQEWYWDFGDPASPFNTSTLQHPTHLFTSAGTYTVKEIVTNQSGCQDTVIKDITINEAPPVEFTSGPACLGEPTFFAIDSTIVNWAMTTSYLWDFGDGGFTNITNPTHVYNTVGTFNVTLTVTDTNGCQNSITHEVTVNPLPLANFDHSGPVCLYDSVFFQDYSSTTYGYIVSWTWDFDDGSPTETIYFPNNPNVWHQYSIPGTYGVTLTVTNSDSCSHTFIREVVVNDAPIANFQWDSSCEDELVQFSDASYPNLPGSIISWYWDFDDPGSGVNNNSWEQNPMHLFTHGDSTYNVMLIIVTNDNCSDTITKPVYISETPAVDFGYDISCEDTLISFWPDTTVMNSQIIASWHWDFGDGGQAYNPYVQHLYTVPGTYTVTLTVTDIYGCTNSMSHDITVIESPEAIFTTSAPNCENNPVYFDDNSSTASGYIVSWHWDYGDGEDTTIYYPSNPDISHTYELLGTYGATLTVTTSDSCQSSMTQWITIDPAPMANFDYDGSCASELFDFYDLSVPNGGGQITGWYWDFGDPASGINNNSMLQNPQHQFSAPGTYEVLLQITNINGCVDTVTQSVEAVEGEPAGFSWDGTCMRDVTQFYIDQTITNPANVALYDWDFGDGTPHSNQMEPTHSYTNYGVYDVVLTITNLSGCQSMVTHQVEITPRPITVFNYTASCIGIETQFEDLSYVITGEDIIGWQWNFGDPSSPNNTSTEQHPEHVYSQAGIYRVTLAVTSASGCMDSTYLDIQVHEGPQAWFSYDVSACSNGQVSFADSSHSQFAGIAGWLWIFEPGNQSTLQAPHYIFPESDTCYDVTLIVTDTRGCQDTVVRSVCIPDGLEVEIQHNSSCHNEAVTFSDTVLSPAGTYLVTYHWDFGEPMQPGNISTLPTPTHTYANPGAYTVRLDATDNNGCTVTVYEQVIIDPLPVSDFTWDLLDCDTLAMFYDQSTGSGVPVAQWQWYFGDGTPTQTFTPPLPARVEHKFPAPGTYPVTLVVTNDNGCVDTLTQDVTVNPCINSLFALEDTLCCERADLTFTDSTTNNPYVVMWEWTWGDGTDTVYIHHTPTISHTYQDPGTYMVRLVVHGYVNNTNVYDTSYRQVDVKASPLADFSCGSLCYGDVANFLDNSSSNVQVQGWSWDFGDLANTCDTSNIQHPTYYYAETGDYDVCLTITNRHGCSDSIRKTISVSPRPDAAFQYTPVCIGNETRFSDISNAYGSEIVSWRWNFGDPDTPADTSLTKNPVYKYDELGFYDVVLLVANESGCMDTIKETVEVHPVPASDFSIVENWDDVQGNVLVNNQTFGATEYEWHWGDGMTTYEDEDPITHQYDMDGIYTVTLISWNEHGCQDTAVIEYEFIFKSLYVPNAFAPAGGNPKISQFKPRGIGLKSYLIQVYDTWGNILWESSKLDDDGRPVEGWDGTFKGELLPQDVYMWRVKAQFRDGSTWEGESIGNMQGLSKKAQGTVTLIR